MSRIDIVIVNWNSGNQLKKCLSSIDRLNPQVPLKVIVVDNASDDGSANDLDRYHFPLQVICNHENFGFARACNQGANESDAPYLLFLNPDTELFTNSLIGPLTCMEDRPNSDIGVCGIQLIDENGKVAKTCARFPSLWRFIVDAVGLNKFPGLRSAGIRMDDWDHLTNKPVNHVMGAFFFMRRKLYKALNGFDERFFVYLEDVDLSLRAKKAGWRSDYLADSKAFHKGGGTSRQVKAERLFYSLRSRLQYGLKHFPRWQAWSLIGVTLLVEPLSRSVFSLLRQGIGDLRNTWVGYCMLYRDLPNILRSRN